MSNLNGEAPIQRIVKKKGGHGGHHGGAWKVAYADFVTAMMALFIVLWIMAQSQSIRQNVAQYFKDPGILPSSQGLMEKSDMGGEMPTPGQSQPLQKPPPAPAEVADDAKRFEETKKKIQEMIAQLPELQALKDQVRLEITDEGLRIELLEREDARFFDVGSANVNPQAQKIFGVISKELGLLPNHLTIEGHTDSRPYGKQQNYTNWELSSDRANAARRLMEGTGLKPGQVADVRGYADRHLFNQADSTDYRNRRVSIIVKPLNKDPDKPLIVDLPPKTGAAPAGSESAKTPPPPPPASPAAPAVKVIQPPAGPPPGAEAAPPAASPLAVGPPPPKKDKAASGPGPGEQKAATPPPPPPEPKAPKAERGPLEEKTDLQKELQNIAPPPPVFSIK